MIQLGLSSMDILWVAFLATFSFFFVVSGLSVKPEHRVTYMNSGWTKQEAKKQQSGNNLLVSFTA